MKFMIRAFILLLLTNALLVFMHYYEAGNALVVNAKGQSYGQEIEVMNREDGLHVRHHFTDLPNARVEIIWPETSTERACYVEDADACSRLNENMTAFEEGSVRSQSISYVIPKEGSMTDTMFFEDAFVALHQTSVSSTIMHITDEMDLGGVWVNGLTRVGEKKMELVGYSLFKGFGAAPDLYWQQTDQPVQYEDAYLTVFGEELQATDEQIEEMTEVLRRGDALHSTIMFDKNHSPINTKRFVVANHTNLEQVVETLLMNSLHNQYVLPTDEQLTVELVASLVSGRAVGSEVARSAYEQLQEELTEAELEQLATAIHENDQEMIDAKFLTNQFIEITGYRTAFFEKNRQATEQLHPFILEEVKEIYVAGEEPIESGAILRDGQTLYPAIEILRELGYDVTWNEQSLYVTNEEKDYRFPLKEKFYVYNERRFDVSRIPFERIGDEFYFEERSLIQIFHMKIEKQENHIEINMITMFNE